MSVLPVFPDFFRDLHDDDNNDDFSLLPVRHGGYENIKPIYLEANATHPVTPEQCEIEKP